MHIDIGPKLGTTEKLNSETEQQPEISDIEFDKAILELDGVPIRTALIAARLAASWAIRANPETTSGIATIHGQNLRWELLPSCPHTSPPSIALFITPDKDGHSTSAEDS